MLRRLLPALVVVLALGFVPGSAATPAASPDGTLDTNPLGSLSWVPNNANEQPSGASVFRLTVEYDHSLGADGEPTELLAKGPFGMKLFTTAVANSRRDVYPVRVVGHSPHVQSIDDAYGAPAEADALFAGFSGDVRDGDCAKVGTEAFSAAFSTTEKVTTDSATLEPAPCQVVDGTVDNLDGTFTHTVTTFTPGFWVDIAWPTETDPVSGTPGRALAEIWYGTVYDTGGDDGEWYAAADSTATSTSTHEPGRYIANVDLLAPVPEPAHSQCVGPFVPEAPTVGEDSWDEFTVDIPEGVTRAVFQLHPNGGDWDMRVTKPDDAAIESGAAPPYPETVDLFNPAPGTYTVRGCNFAGPPSVDATVAIER